jgi:tetratricopeptide (TPR) repeat protein
LAKKFFLVFQLFWLCISYAQKSDYARFFNQGNKALLSENYPTALENFKKAYLLDSLNANINFKLGYCYYALHDQREKSENYLSKAVLDVTKEYKETDASQLQAPYYAFFYYAEALHYNHKLELAAKMFGNYEDFLEQGSPGVDSVRMEYHENMLVFAKKDLESAGSIIISNLGENINTSGAEYAPVIDGEENLLIFTYRGEKTTGAAEGIRTEEGKFFEDIYFSERQPDGNWSKAGPLTNGVNTNGHDAAVNLSFDGQTLIVYKDEDGDGNLYFTERQGKQWGPLQKFGPEINSPHWEPSACFSLDKTVFYFVSDRPGGAGGRDIYRCRRLPNGEWSKAENLGPHINTPLDEEGPFLHANGMDFFFSSQGHKSLGGFDILLAELKQDETFTAPIHLSYPINTTEDDIFYFVSSDEKRAYYSTDKKSLQAKGDKDIYVITIEGVEVCALLRGSFIPGKNKALPEKISIRVTDANGKLVGKFVPNSKGDFVAILKSGAGYIAHWEQDGKILRTDSITIPNSSAYSISHEEISLRPYEFAGEEIVLKDENSRPNTDTLSISKNGKSTVGEVGLGPLEFVHNFNYNITQVEQNSEAKNFLDELLSRLSSGKSIKIYITASASRVPTTKFGGSNYKLAQQRALNFKTDLESFLKANKVDVSKIKFVSKAIVGGPAYKRDADTNREVYKKHQYTRVRVE